MSATSEVPQAIRDIIAAADIMQDLADELDDAHELINALRADLQDAENENEDLSSRIEELERQE